MKKSIVAVAALGLLANSYAADLALRFDGTNDFVTFGPAPGLGASNFTVEVWFMRQGVGVTTNTGSGGFFAVPLVTKGRAEADGSNVDMNYFLGIATNNALAADFEQFSDGLNQPVFGTTPILNGVWYHAAVTYNGTNWALYLNDTLVATATVGAGILPRYDSIQHAGLATAMSSSGQPAGAFAGILDEARIWNYARTQQQIKDTTRVAITNAQPGLLGRWGLDEGSGTIASNTAVPAVTGILSNGPTYVAGYPFALAGVGGLYFDGDNDYVTFGPTNALGLTTFTIETWFKRTGTGKSASTGAGGHIAIPLVAKGRNESDGSNVDMNYFFGIRTNDNRLCGDFERTPDGTNQPVVGVTTILNDVWYHAAATYDGSNWRLYLNGVLETNLFVGQTPRSDSIQHAGLGTAMNSSGVTNGAFQGVLDEVRIWNYARSGSEIQNNMTNAIPSAAGLVGRWSLDEEWGTVAQNTASSGVSGLHSNGPVSVAGQILTPPGSGALFFDGNNDYVTFGSGGGLGLATFTIETWFRRDGAGVAANSGAGGVFAIPLVTKGRGEVDELDNRDMNYFFGIRTNDNRLCADFETFATGTNRPVVGTTVITNGGWYHAAATYNGSNWALYLNGILETNVFVGEPPRYDSIQHAGLGTAMNSTGAPEGYFNGALEEVRIWNYARSATEILSNKNYRIQGAVGLVGRWGLDHTTGVVATNSALGGVNGSLINGPYWTAGTPLGILSSAPPNTPILVSPANNATGILSSVTLSASVTDTDSPNVVVTFYGRLTGQTAGPDFTLVHVPDTQYYVSSLNGGTPAMFISQTVWIVNNRVSRNIAFVTHSGDCVENGDSFLTEWTNATNAMYRLENPITTGLPEGMAYGIAPGNHDQSPNGNPNGTTTYYNQFFGESHFLGRSYYGGHSSTNNDSHYELFSAGGMDFVVLHLEWAATNAVNVAWANSVMQANPSRRAIVTSHNLINTGNPASFAAQGQFWYNALRTNSNWFLAICGHVAGEGRRQDTFNGNTVYTIMADYQSRTNGGNGWMRLFEFSPSNNLITVKTYNPFLNQSETDADSQFTLSYNMAGSSGFSVIGVSNNVPSGSTPTMFWSGLLPGTNYEWYVTVSDGLQTVSSGTNHFSTAPSSVSGNLVAAYSFDEGAGTSVTDSSGYANNGTTSSTTWTNAGKNGKALVFNGTNAKVNVNDSLSLRLTNAMTLEAWVYPTAALASWKDIVYKGDDNYFLMAGSVPSGYPAVGGTFGGNNVAIPGSATLPINTWTHLAGTYDGSTLRLYTNGLLASSAAQTGSILTSANPLQIGGDNFYSDQHFQGRIDDVRVYNVALSGAQILSDMNTPVGSTPPDSDSDGLLDSWEMFYLGTLGYGGGDDPDGDGKSNMQEFLSGTNPNSNADVLRIKAITREGNSLRITWITGPDKTNALQRTAGGAGGSYNTNNFVDIFTVTNTVGSTTNYLDSGAATNKPARYYRVRLVP